MPFYEHSKPTDMKPRQILQVPILTLVRFQVCFRSIVLLVITVRFLYRCLVNPIIQYILIFYISIFDKHDIIIYKYFFSFK